MKNSSMNPLFYVILGAVIFVTVIPSGIARAADFYAGKTIEILVGGPAGGGFDIYARAIAPHWSKFIPGNPTFIIKNMPGGGGSRAAAFVSSAAKTDGTVLAAPSPGAILAPLLDDNAPVDFDPRQVIYLGTVDSGVRVCVTFETSKVKTAEDALNIKAIMGATAPGGSSSDYAFLHRRTSGKKFEIVLGYQGMPDVGLAMERGELDGTCGWDWSSLKSMKPDWIRDKKINVLFQVALHPDPELTAMGVPEVWKYLTTEQDRKVVELIASQQVFLRFFIAPPKTPEMQVQQLRDGFNEAVKSDSFLHDAERQKLSVKPLSGEKIQELVARIYSTPKNIAERAKWAIKP